MKGIVVALILIEGALTCMIIAAQLTGLSVLNMLSNESSSIRSYQSPIAFPFPSTLYFHGPSCKVRPPFLVCEAVQSRKIARKLLKLMACEK